MTNPQSSFFPEPTAERPLLTFDEARRYHLLSFARTTVEQRIQWLADMLELMHLAQVVRENRSSPEKAAEEDRS